MKYFNPQQIREQEGKLAVNGGVPIREKGLPPEWPGLNYFDDQEKQAVMSILDNKSPFRFYGPKVQGMCDSLEREFALKSSSKYALAVNSGSVALYTCLAALEVGPGDEVLVPGYLWTSCFNAIIKLGAIPRLVDIDASFCMSPEDLEHKITPHSKAVMYVHMSGASGNIEEIAEVARKHNLKLLEDCAQSTGTKVKGKSIGTFGDMGIFSFQINKNMTAGDGGMIITGSKHLYNRAFAIHDLGYARDDKGRLMDTSCASEYQLWGSGGRMSELTGAVALVQLRKLDRITTSMRNAKWEIRRAIEEKIPGIKFREVIDPDGDSGAFMLTVYPSREKARNFTEAIRAEGIRGEGQSAPCLDMQQWGLHWYYNNLSLVNKRSLTPYGAPWSLEANSFAENYTYVKGTLPVTDDLSERGALLSIPSALSSADIDDIIRAFYKVAAWIL